MRYWLSVIGAVNCIEDLTDCDPALCVVSKMAVAGDTLFIYVASSHHRAASECSLGIVAMYTILRPAPERARKRVGLGHSSPGGGIVVPMEVSLIERFSPSLAAKDMKNDALLNRSRFFRYNFRGICFRVSGHQNVQIRRLIAAKRLILGAVSEVTPVDCCDG